MSGSISESAGRASYQLGFQISPIIFTGGIASDYYGYIPIILLTEAASFVTNILSGSIPTNLDNFFAHFTPVPGGKLANYTLGKYPFANQIVAANAIISEPLNISLKMSIPVNKPGGHTAKFVTMVMLQKLIDKHASMGGTYIVVTPAAIYTDCILTGLTDISQGNSPIPQNTWQFDFEKPLITISSAQAAQSTFMSKVSNGVATDGSLTSAASSGSPPSVITGVNPSGINPPSIFNGVS